MTEHFLRRREKLINAISHSSIDTNDNNHKLLMSGKSFQDNCCAKKIVLGLRLTAIAPGRSVPD
jgi:hypothetical protein